METDTDVETDTDTDTDTDIPTAEFEHFVDVVSRLEAIVARAIWETGLDSRR